MLLAAGMLKGLVTKGINGIRTLVHNAQVGKQVLSSGATVQTTASGSGLSTIVTPGGNVQLPVWIWYVGGLVLGGLLLVTLFKSVFKKR